MNYIRAVLLFILCGSAYAQPGTFSRDAIDLWSHVAGGTGTIEVPSPDRTSSVIAKGITEHDEEFVRLELVGRLGTKRIELKSGVDAELLWAPDSRGFIVTYSEGGGAGPYSTLIVEYEKGAWSVKDTTGLVIKTFGHPVSCFDPEGPNVVGLKWLPSAHHVLIAAQIYPHSNCDSMGTFTGYDLNFAAMRVVRRYSQIEIKRMLGRTAGPAIVQADDRCVRTPRACWIPALHQSQ